MSDVTTEHRPRLYPLPANAVAEAQRALQWHSAYKEPLGESVSPTAALLAGGGSLTADRIEALDTWFEMNQQGTEGWHPHEDGYPSPARIEWAAHGGNATAKWARKIMDAQERDLARSLVASLQQIEYKPDSFTYLGIMDGVDEDIVRAVVRVGENPDDWESWSGEEWRPVPFEALRRFDAVELEADLVGFVAAAITDGVDGVQLMFAEPLAFLPLSPLLAAVPDDVADGIVYAVVDGNDTTAVMDVIKLTPGPKSYRRTAGAWVEDPTIIDQLKSIAPPPIVELDPPMLDTVLEQVDMAPDPNAAVTANTQTDPAVTAAGDEALVAMLNPDAPSGASSPRPATAPSAPSGSAGHGASGRYFSESKIKRDALGKFAAKPKASLSGTQPGQKPLTGKQAGKIANYIANSKDNPNAKGKGGSGGGGGGSAHSKGSGAGASAAAAAMAARVAQKKLNAKRAAHAKKVTAVRDAYAMAQLVQEKKMLDLETQENARIAAFDKKMEALRDQFAGNPLDKHFAHEFQMLSMDERAARADYRQQVATESLNWKRKAIAMRMSIQQAVMSSAADMRRELAVIETVTDAPLLARASVRRNRGNAETLRRYWTHGKGASKIVWGVAGDFKRCVAQVSKYMTRPEGYCANRHKAATGFWPGHAPTEQ